VFPAGRGTNNVKTGAARFRSRAQGAKPPEVQAGVVNGPCRALLSGRPFDSAHYLARLIRHAQATGETTRAQAQTPMKARSGKQVNRTVKRREALRQQRSDFVRAHGYESARRDRIVTSDRTAGQDREDGQKAAKRQAAVAAVGDGAFRTKTSRLTAFPPNQRASDSHDYTRLATLKVLNASPRKRTVRLKKRDAG
jgi:hypothetical protein